LGRFEVITFDCYGTLIDWETGIRNAFHSAMLQTGASRDLESKAFELYEEEERKVEREKPHVLYRDVLSKTGLSVARKIGWSLPESESGFLARQLPGWLPFPDTNPSLARLSRGHTLGILSNVDNDLLAATIKHFTSPIDIRVTAENVRSYKPAPAHFEEARKVIGERSWVHVAASQYYDIEPAVRLGIRAVWVNRKNGQLNSHYPKTGVLEVKDLAQLAKLLESQPSL
jgi:2-haloalkanoic acid dehalogenase type II